MREHLVESRCGQGLAPLCQDGYVIGFTLQPAIVEMSKVTYKMGILRVPLMCQPCLSFCTCCDVATLQFALSRHWPNIDLSVTRKSVHPSNDLFVPMIRVLHLQDEMILIREYQKLALDTFQLAMCKRSQRNRG